MVQVLIEKTVIPPDVYVADYAGSEELATKFGDALKMIFTLIGGAFDGKQISRLVNLNTTSPKSNIAIFFAALAGVAPDKVVAWIKAGALRAMNVGNGPLKPRYRIDPTDLAAFENSRTVRPVVSVPRSQRKRQSVVMKENF